MITELERETKNRDRIESGIRLCEQAIAKAEKYERLMENSDFKAYLEDLKILASIHQREIDNAIGMLIDAPSHSHTKMDEAGRQTTVSSKQDWADFIARHKIQKTDCETWVQEPDRIIALANLAREKLPILRDQLSELPNHGPVSENGKS